jgi:hypothetical protein
MRNRYRDCQVNADVKVVTDERYGRVYKVMVDTGPNGTSITHADIQDPRHADKIAEDIIDFIPHLDLTLKNGGEVPLMISIGNFFYVPVRDQPDDYSRFQFEAATRRAGLRSDDLNRPGLFRKERYGYKSRMSNPKITGFVNETESNGRSGRARCGDVVTADFYDMNFKLDGIIAQIGHPVLYPSTFRITHYKMAGTVTDCSFQKDLEQTVVDVYNQIHDGGNWPDHIVINSQFYLPDEPGSHDYTNLRSIKPVSEKDNSVKEENNQTVLAPLVDAGVYEDLVNGPYSVRAECRYGINFVIKHLGLTSRAEGDQIAECLKRDMPIIAKNASETGTWPPELWIGCHGYVIDVNVPPGSGCQYINRLLGLEKNKGGINEQGIGGAEHLAAISCITKFTEHLRVKSAEEAAIAKPRIGIIHRVELDGSTTIEARFIGDADFVIKHHNVVDGRLEQRITESLEQGMPDIARNAIQAGIWPNVININGQQYILNGKLYGHRYTNIGAVVKNPSEERPNRGVENYLKKVLDSYAAAADTQLDTGRIVSVVDTLKPCTAGSRTDNVDITIGNVSYEVGKVKVKTDIDGTIIDRIKAALAGLTIQEEIRTMPDVLVQGIAGRLSQTLSGSNEETNVMLTIKVGDVSVKIGDIEVHVKINDNKTPA